MTDFWKKLKNKQQPIYVLAPMAGITDSPWRQICKSFGADVVVSEMASVAALAYQPTKTLAMLKSQKSEAPYVIQLFGSKPEQFAMAVRLLVDTKKIKSLGIKNWRSPDGFDINFGCPVPKVLKQGAGSALFKDLAKSRQVIEAVLDNTDLPLSIKVRARVGRLTVIDFLKNIQDLPISALMIHGRSLAQGFNGAVDAEIIKEAKKYFKGVVIANGGVNNLNQGQKLLKVSLADGLGLARGVSGRPWLFQELKTGQTIVMSQKQIFKLMLKHAVLVEKYNGNFKEFRKHLLWYTAGWPGTKELRQKLIKIESLAEIKAILRGA